MVRLGGSYASGRAAQVEDKHTYSSWVLARPSAGCGLGQLRPESVERAWREFDKQARAEPSFAGFPRLRRVGCPPRNLPTLNPHRDEECWLLTSCQKTAAKPFHVGPIHVRVLEDGSGKDNRLGAVGTTKPLHTDHGPPPTKRTASGESKVIPMLQRFFEQTLSSFRACFL